MVTAPQPRLAIAGHHALITEVRYVWTAASCAWCRRMLHLHTDGGRVEAGIGTRQTRTRGTAGWYTTFRPATAPVPPAGCPDPHCRSHARKAGGWVDGARTLTVGPFGDTWHRGQPQPAHPQVHHPQRVSADGFTVWALGHVNTLKPIHCATMAEAVKTCLRVTL